MQVCFLAPAKLAKDLETEISFNKDLQLIEKWERLFLCQCKSATVPSLVFAQDTWLNCERLKVDSIGDAAKKLKSIHKFWIPYQFQLFRRAELIQNYLPKIKDLTLTFLAKPPVHSFAVWSLISENEVLFSKEPQKKYPLGELNFVEDKAAPSRAFNKLWEAFTLLDFKPERGSRVMDLGSCPGGWTRVLASLGCEVLSVDKAPLDEKVMKMKNVEYLKKDAFKLKPEDVPELDWLFSDIICTPARLWDLAQVWLQSGRVKNFLCTIKFKGETDFETLRKFQQIPGSQVLHLHANKHEVTWILRRDQQPTEND